MKQASTFVMLILDAELEASLLLADIVWEQLARDIPGNLIAAVPARHFLVVSGTGVTGGIDVLRHAVSQVWDDPSVNPGLLLTRSVLIRRGGAWQLMD